MPLLLAAIASIIFVAVGSLFPIMGIDWIDVFRPAARELLLLRNPYEVPGFYYPTWTLFILMPFAILPEPIGRTAFLLVSGAAFGYTAYRLGAKPLVLGAFLLSPPVIHCLLNANIDWMVLLGFVLPPQIGLFLVLIKPQTGFVVALYWVVEAWRNGGPKEVFRVVWPVTVGMLLSFLIFGLWPLRASGTVGFFWNASLWPMSIPVGLGLLVAAFRTRQKRYAMAASPCLSPYVLFHSWSAAFAAVIPHQLEFFAAWVGLWILVLIRAM
jgi:hypothetical protein